MKRAFLNLLVAISLTGFASCSDDDDPKVPSEPKLEATTESETIPAEGGDLVIKVNANSTWTYEIDAYDADGQLWLSAKNQTERELTLTAAPAGKTERQATVTLTSSRDAALKRVFNFTQEAKEDDPTPPTPPTPEKPEARADLLDVVFNADGTAEDISPKKYVVKTVAGNMLTTAYNEIYKRYSCILTHETIGIKSEEGFYRVDYGTEMEQALADGHSLEALFKPGIQSDLTQEIKVISATQAGGTAIMISKKANEGGTLNFLVNANTKAGTSKWNWCSAGVNPEAGQWYHVIGVWNQEEGKARVYLNGQLVKEIDAPGTFKPSTLKWFAIGADPASSAGLGEGVFNGEIAIARVYDSPLTDAEVAARWNEVNVK